MGDLCHNVTNSMLNYLQGGTLYNLLNYYINCKGINPFEKPYDSVADSLDVFTYFIEHVETAMQSSGQTCAYLTPAQAGITKMKEGLAKVLTAFECKPFSLAWKVSSLS